MQKHLLTIVLSLLLLVVGSYRHLLQPVPVAANLSRFPEEMAEWKKDPSVIQAEWSFGNHDHKMLGAYRNGSGERMVVYIGYIEKQEEDKQLVNQATRALQRGASVIKIAGTGHEDIEINQVIREEDGKKKLALFWYAVNGRIVTSPTMVKAYSAWDALTKRRTNGSLIVIMSDLSTAQESSGIPQQSQKIIQAAWPFLEAYLPRA